jgi:hypothetical protein
MLNNNPQIPLGFTSKYSVLSNKPITKEFIGGRSKISFTLPCWFTNWNGQKLIKVYGCSFSYLETENKEPKPSSRYANQFISVHSNITRADTEHLSSIYTEDGTRPTSNEIELFVDFMMVANNYYTPKIYDLTNSTEKEIVIWFKDAYGQQIKLREPFTPNNGQGEAWSEFYQAVFKIEIELAIADEQK